MPAISTTTADLNNAEPPITVISNRPAYYCMEHVQQNPLPEAVTISQSLVPDKTQTAQSDAISSEEPKTLADLAIAQLLRFATLHRDWDGNDAAKPSTGSLADARAFLRSLAPESVIPQATLHANGNAVLLLRGPEIYAEIEFLGQKRIGFFSKKGEQTWGDEILYDGGKFPAGLSQIGLKPDD